MLYSICAQHTLPWPLHLPHCPPPVHSITSFTLTLFCLSHVPRLLMPLLPILPTALTHSLPPSLPPCFAPFLPPSLPPLSFTFTPFLPPSSEPVECNEPIIVASHKLGVCRVDSAGKPCSTLFTKLSYNGSSSLLRCEIVIHYVGGPKERTIFHTIHYSAVYATTVLDFPNRSATCTIHLCIVLCIMEINYCTREMSRGTHNTRLYTYTSQPVSHTMISALDTVYT